MPKWLYCHSPKDPSVSTLHLDLSTGKTQQTHPPSLEIYPLHKVHYSTSEQAHSQYAVTAPKCSSSSHYPASLRPCSFSYPSFFSFLSPPFVPVVLIRVENPCYWFHLSQHQRGSYVQIDPRATTFPPGPIDQNHPGRSQTLRTGNDLKLIQWVRYQATIRRI